MRSLRRHGIFLIWRCDIQQVENGSELEAIGMGGGVAQVMLQGSGGEPQVLQVLSLKDATVLTKAMVRVDLGTGYP